MSSGAHTHKFKQINIALHYIQAYGCMQAYVTIIAYSTYITFITLIRYITLVYIAFTLGALRYIALHRVQYIALSYAMCYAVIHKKSHYTHATEH